MHSVYPTSRARFPAILQIPQLAGLLHALRRSGPLFAPAAILAILVLVLATLRSHVLTLDELNVDTSATMTLILVATGETLVILRGGIDLAVGGLLSLSTAIAATQLGKDPIVATAWVIVILLLGAGVGALNGALTSILGLQPFLVTLATWSISGGAALMILPTEGGSVPAAWVAVGSATMAGLSLAVWALLMLLVWWVWFRRTRLALTIRAAGSNERSAFLCGVSLRSIDVSAYALSGLFAALGGLFLTSQTGSGSPTVGNDFVLPAVAAVVIGGTSLFGGRGGLTGTVLGAFILTEIGNVVFVLQISSYWQPIASGLILVLAVLLTSLAEQSTRRGEEGT
jgi:ribose transport system permease protein